MSESTPPPGPGRGSDPPAVPAPTRGRARVPWLPLVVLVLGTLFALGAGLSLHDVAAEAIDQRFGAAADDTAARIQAEVDRAVDALRSGVGLFESSSEVTHEEFAGFVVSLDLSERFPAVSGYAAITQVRVADVPALVAVADELGVPDFTVRPDVDPAAGRDVLRPILFNEPLATNAAAIGFDVRANPVADEATTRAAREGRAIMTAPTTLVQETGDQTGLVVYAPLPGIRPEATGAPGVAFVSAVFRGEDFLEGVFHGSPLPVVVTVRDAAGGGPAGDGTIGTWWSRASDEPPDTGRMTTRSIDVAGRTWLVAVSARAGAYGTPGPAPVLTALFGVLATMGLAAMVQSQRTRERHAHELADRLTEDLRDNEQRLAESNRQLRQSNEELSRFAYVASHDLQEPLRMVTSFLGLLERHLDERLEDGLDADGREYLGFAVDGASRMSGLIQDILLLSRVERTVPRRVDVDIELLVRRVLRTLSGRVEEVGGEVEVRRTAPCAGDPTGMEQLIQNLVGNALKFHRDDRPPRVVVDAWAEGDTWHLTVADDGIGVEPPYREQIFAAFRRLHGRQDYEGTGIGLAVCHRVASAHGGTIAAEDGIDGGLCMHVRIPGGVATATAG